MSKSVKFSANYVVKNEEEYIEQSIRQTAQVAREILIFDTGSTDNTVEIIKRLRKEFPIRLFQSEDSNVTQARDLLLKMSRNPWILTVDGDEVWENPRPLKNLPLDYPEMTAFCFTFNHHLPDGRLADHHSKSVRLFKKTPDVIWKKRFPAEMLVDSKGYVSLIEKNRNDVMFVEDLRFEHYGAVKKHQWRENQPTKFR